MLWLFGEDHEVTEAGAMNVFILWKNEATGRTELVTPPLDNGMILPGKLMHLEAPEGNTSLNVVAGNNSCYRLTALPGSSLA